MTWMIYNGGGVPHPAEIPDPPPWRQFPIKGPDTGGTATFRPTTALIEAINAAIYLRRPLLITGPAGSGKSSVAESIAHELQLGSLLRWHVTSRSTLEEALYRYDALGRLQHNQLKKQDNIELFLRLGPLGTALVAASAPRVLLIDELDKCDLDLPGDLLNVLDRGEYVIQELNRSTVDSHQIREVDNETRHEVVKGRISCTHFPIIIMTSNGERDFPAPFLRRCVRARLDLPDETRLVEIVKAHFATEQLSESTAGLVKSFADRIAAAPPGQANLAVDQLLNAVFLLTHENAPTSEERTRLEDLLLRELNRS